MAYLCSIVCWGNYTISIGTYAVSVFTGANPKVISIVITLLLFAINLFNIKAVARLQNVVTWVLIACLIVFVIFGLFNLTSNPFEFSAPDFFPNGFGGFLSAVVLLVYSCQAYSMTFNFSGLAEKPRRNVPKSMILCALTIFVFYGLAGIVATHVLPISECAAKPLTVIAAAFFPEWMVWVFVLAGVEMAIISSLNGLYAGQGALFAEASKDGWYPKWLRPLNKHDKPYVLFTIGTVLACLFCIFDVSIALITNCTILVKLFYDIMPVASVFMLPKKFPEQFETSPLKMTRPVFFVLLVLGFAAMLFCSIWSAKDAGLVPTLISVGVLIVCIVYGYMRGKSPESRAPDYSEFVSDVDD